MSLTSAHVELQQVLGLALVGDQLVCVSSGEGCGRYTDGGRRLGLQAACGIRQAWDCGNCDTRLHGLMYGFARVSCNHAWAW